MLSLLCTLPCFERRGNSGRAAALPAAVNAMPSRPTAPDAPQDWSLSTAGQDASHDPSQGRNMRQLLQNGRSCKMPLKVPVATGKAFYTAQFQDESGFTNPVGDGGFVEFTWDGYDRGTTLFAGFGTWYPGESGAIKAAKIMLLPEGKRVPQIIFSDGLPLEDGQMYLQSLPSFRFSFINATLEYTYRLSGRPDKIRTIDVDMSGTPPGCPPAFALTACPSVKMEPADNPRIPFYSISMMSASPIFVGNRSTPPFFNLSMRWLQDDNMELTCDTAPQEQTGWTVRIIAIKIQARPVFKSAFWLNAVLDKTKAMRLGAPKTRSYWLYLNFMERMNRPFIYKYGTPGFARVIFQRVVFTFIATNSMQRVYGPVIDNFTINGVSFDCPRTFDLYYPKV